jgi:hypothetical protein
MHERPPGLYRVTEVDLWKAGRAISDKRRIISRSGSSRIRRQNVDVSLRKIVKLYVLEERSDET